MATISVPDYAGGTIVNLVAEIERRMTGAAPFVGLHDHLARLVPQGDGVVLVVFDGLGSHQLLHPAARVLAADQVSTIDAPFPATTTVSLASIATGLVPAQHGLIGYQMWMPDLAVVVNTIKWTTLWGEPVDYSTGGLLPEPNLWERLAEAGVDTVTVQPAGFDRSPLTKALYRGCRFEPAETVGDLIDATVGMAGAGRVVFAYVPQIDFAAHVYGQQSEEYAAALEIAATVWGRLCERIPAGVTLVGSADHGHVDFPLPSQHKIAKSDHEGRTFYGDGRAMFVRGPGADLAESLPATWIPLETARPWWGPGPEHPGFAGRAPDGILLADDDALLLHRFSDDRMVGNHGAMTRAEQQVPLLVRTSVPAGTS